MKSLWPSLIFLLVFILGSISAKGGGHGGGHGGGGHGGGGHSSGGRGSSGARSSVGSSSGSHGSYSGYTGSAGRSSFSSAAKGAAIGGAVGFAAGMGTHAVISSHQPIHNGHYVYYWNTAYIPTKRKNITACRLNITDDPLLFDFEFDNSTTSETPEQVIWECPIGRCDLENMECIENDKSTLITVVVVIVLIICIAVIIVIFGRCKKMCAKKCAEPVDRQARYTYDVDGGHAEIAQHPTPIPRRLPPLQRPGSAKI